MYEIKWLSCLSAVSKPHTVQINDIISCNCVLTFQTVGVSNDRPYIKIDSGETVKCAMDDNEY